MLQRLAQYAYEAAQFDDSISYYRQFLARAPNHPDRIKLAQLFFDLGDRDRAIDEVRSFLNYNTGDAAAKRLLDTWVLGRGTQRPLPTREPPDPPKETEPKGSGG